MERQGQRGFGQLPHHARLHVRGVRHRLRKRQRELAKIDPKASMASVSSRWPVVLARLLDQQPAGWLPSQYADWQALQVAAMDRVIRT
jgi:hypothetical protein